MWLGIPLIVICPRAARELAHNTGCGPLLSKRSDAHIHRLVSPMQANCSLCGRNWTCLTCNNFSLQRLRWLVATALPPEHSSIPGQSMWDLWWIKCQYGRLFHRYDGVFSCHYSYTNVQFPSSSLYYSYWKHDQPGLGTFKQNNSFSDIVGAIDRKVCSQG